MLYLAHLFTLDSIIQRISDEVYSSEVWLRDFMIYINFVLRKQGLCLEFSTPTKYRIICTKDLIVTFKVVTVNMIEN